MGEGNMGSAQQQRRERKPNNFNVNINCFDIMMMMTTTMICDYARRTHRVQVFKSISFCLLICGSFGSHYAFLLLSVFFLATYKQMFYFTLFNYYYCFMQFMRTRKNSFKWNKWPSLPTSTTVGTISVLLCCVLVSEFIWPSYEKITLKNWNCIFK